VDFRPLGKFPRIEGEGVFRQLFGHRTAQLVTATPGRSGGRILEITRLKPFKF